MAWPRVKMSLGEVAPRNASAVWLLPCYLSGPQTSGPFNDGGNILCLCPLGDHSVILMLLAWIKRQIPQVKVSGTILGPQVTHTSE